MNAHKAAPRSATTRDPWAYVAVLAVIPLVVHMWGAPLGVPVADDFDYLYRVALSGQHSLLDGCGSIFYWRPLSRQVYFEALWRVMVTAPAIVAWLHVGLLAATSLILYRAFRVNWSAPLAAAAATFPLLAESSRMLLTWPSNFQDLAALFFAALALHEAAYRRLATAMGALLLSLLSKEVGVLAALLLPWMPHGRPAGRRVRERLRWTLWTATVVAVWGMAYVAVSRHAGLVLPSQLETNPAALGTPIVERLVWAVWNSLRGAFSLPAVHVPGEIAVVWAPLGLLGLAASLLFAFRRAARQRLRALYGWSLWGAAWFVVAAATLLAIFPTWAAYRGIFATLGLGVALVALLGAAHPLLAGALVAIRLTAFALSPGPPAGVTSASLVTGAAIDFPNLVRIQRLVGETRDLLKSEFASLPAGAVVVQHHLPLATEWAFVGSKALQVWYADSTLRWVRFEAFQRDTTLAATTVLEYQPHRALQLALVEPDALRKLIAAQGAIEAGDWRTTLSLLQEAEDAQRDPGAAVFLGTITAKRALALAGLNDAAGAEREARRAMALWPDNPDSRYVLAYLWDREGRYAEAVAQLDTMLALYPNDRGAIALRERIRAIDQGKDAP